MSLRAPEERECQLRSHRARRCGQGPAWRSAPASSPGSGKTACARGSNRKRARRHRAGRVAHRRRSHRPARCRAESCEMLGRPRMLAVGRIDVGNAWRSVAGPRPLVARIGLELPFLDAPAPWIEHRRRRLVGEQLGRLLQLFQQPCMHRPQRESGAADPIGQGGTIERDTLARIDLRLPLERRVVGIFGDQHMRDQCLGGYAVLDQPLRRRRLHHFAGAWQPYLLRRVTITLNCAGITSSSSETSSPIWCLRPPQHARVLSATSLMVSSRGRLQRQRDALCSPQHDPCYRLFWVVLVALPCTTLAEAVDLDAGWARRTPG